MAVQEFLQDGGKITSIICLDRKIFAYPTGKTTYKKIKLEFLTPSDIRGCQIIVNTIYNIDRERLLEVCSAAKANLIDLTFPSVDELPEIKRKPTKTWALFQAGLSPGITNILAARITREEKSSDEMQILVFHSRYGQGYTFPFGFDEAIEYALKTPVKVENGEMKSIEALHREKMKVPDDKNPVGMFTFRDYYGYELKCISKNLEEKNIKYAYGGADADYLDTIRTMYKSLSKTNTPEEAKEKVMRFFSPMKQEESKKIEGISGAYVRKGNKIYGVAGTKNEFREAEYLNYITIPMASFVGAVINNNKDIPIGVFTPERLPEKVQNEIMQYISKHFKNVIW